MTDATEPARALGRSVSGMAVGTVVSRALGFVRTSVWAWALGLQIVGSAFLVANTVPTIIYTLLAGGVLNTMLVPLLARAARDPDGAAYVDRLLTVALLLLAAVTIAAVTAAPLIASAYAGDNWTAADTALAVSFAFWCLPQIFFYGVHALLGQVLAVRGSFAPMMWAPVVNNVVAIAVGLLFVWQGTVDRSAGPGASTSLSGAEVAFLGGGATLGVAVQALVLVPALRRCGFRYRPRLDVRGAGLGSAGRTAVWTVLYVLVNQITFWVVTRVANTAGSAGADAAGHAVGMPSYTNAYLLMLLPHGIVTVSIATALLPRMSAAAAEHDDASVRADVTRGLSGTMLATVPAAVAFVAFGPLIGRVAFFGNPADDARHIGVVLMAFAPALVAFSAQYLLLRAFYARQDTRTPFLVQLVIAAINIGAVLTAQAVLPPELVVVGMAAGYSLTYLFGVALSALVLRRALGGLGGHGGLGGRRILAAHARLLAAAAPAGAASGTLAWWLTDAFGTTPAVSLAILLGCGSLFALGFLAAASRLAPDEIRAAIARLGRLTRRRQPGAG